MKYPNLKCEKTEPVNPLKDVYTMRMLVTDLEAERTARKALEEALWRANRECCQIGHPHADQHAHDAPCPVEERIVAALALAAKLP